MSGIVREAPTVHSSLADHGVRSVYWGTMAYEPAVKMMEEAQRDRIAGAIPDTIVYLEHEPVITFGRATPREQPNRAIFVKLLRACPNHR